MRHASLIHHLARHRGVFGHLLSSADPEEQRWRAAPEKWCLLETVCHLYDEEREDFHARLQHALETPDTPQPPTDPPGWMTSRKYMEQDYTPMLTKFLAERDRSVAWLQGLHAPKWSNAYQHPKVGALSAEFFLANWVAHDLHHIRQINAMRYAYLAATCGVRLDYAGTW